MFDTRYDQNVQGLTISPSRAVAYQVPAHWIVSGRSSKARQPKITQATPETKKARNRSRVIARYWHGVGWLWIRSRNVKVPYGEGKSMKFRQGFLTLTLPGVATADHKAIKNKVLDPFFTYCRNRLGLKDYVWTAELQERGEIHFHAIVNTFMDKDRVRRAWISACERSGIVQMANSVKKPATEIEKCKSYNGSKVYAAKYLGKALRSGDIMGRIWSGSHSVTGPRKISTNEIEAEYDINKALKELEDNQHEWTTLDHEVRVTRLQTQPITRRRYPYIWRLLMAELRTYDNPIPAPVRQPEIMGHRRHVATTTGLERDRTISHQADPFDLSQHRNSTRPIGGILLQDAGMGAEEGPVGDLFAYIPRGSTWGY